MSDQSMAVELERLRAENEQLKSEKSRKSEISFKVSQKGALSVYGMGRFPVTLYREQWERLLNKKDDILHFIKEHNEELKVKN